MLKKNWQTEELIENWTLIPQELKLLTNKIGGNKIGFAIILKYFQLRARFPDTSEQIPDLIISYIANQLNIPVSSYSDYNPQGRSAKVYRAEIRTLFNFRTVTTQDSEQISNWLIAEIIPNEQKIESIKEIVYQKFRELQIEPPTANRIERLIRHALSVSESQWCNQVTSQLTTIIKEQIDILLKTDDNNEDESTSSPKLKTSDFAFIKTDPGPVGLDTFLTEIEKLKRIRAVGLSTDLFQGISAKIIQKYRQRAATESPYDLRQHPEPIRYTLMSAFCHQRSQEITDNLIEILISIIKRIGTRAEKRIQKELIEDFKLVNGKTNILFRIAEVALANPEGVIQTVVYPVVSQETLKNLVKEYKSTNTAYRQKVHTVMRSSFATHYRRMIPQLLEVLKFRSNNDIHRPIILALELLKKYTDSKAKYYDLEEKIPIEGVLKTGWKDIIIEKTDDGKERINRINYEIIVLQALKERLTCKEIWVVGADRYRNPDEDLPTDFEHNRILYYQALKLPENVESFITGLQQQMRFGLEKLNQQMLNNTGVKIIGDKNGLIRVSLFEPVDEPPNLQHIKGEINNQWHNTSLLDILKETDLRVNFTQNFKSMGTREIIERESLQKRLLLCIYGMGTNTGLKRINTGINSENYHDLLYVRRRYIQKDQLRSAIASVVNAIFEIRNPEIWGEGTTTCASDSKHFGSWEQNLMSQYHLRYGGRGVMIYWHVEKKSTCIYSQLKTVSSSEVAAMIEGVLRHCTDMDVKKNYVDKLRRTCIVYNYNNTNKFVNLNHAY